ncbi:ubiquitin fusion degradation protein [Entomophthora muscae]|uniref:Ubiquitin fusion degradation protein n=1 Tax=Entomophthora muscae TaxID=34485 RepID=A0ACC2SG74_9FUNG|nr:ubiquitin fusion degradation protein [Entomophthora muscae]
MFRGFVQDEDEAGEYSNLPFGFGGFGMPVYGSGNNFSESYRCFPVDELPGSSRINVNFGGKIMLPPSALVKLSNLNITYPMLFELKAENEKFTHAGVLEFIAEEGRVYIPRWMMASLAIEKGAIIEVTNTELKLGKFVRIQPQSPDFLDITDPKAVLENAFRNFSCLTKEEIITISYNDQLYDILVMEIKPEGRGISIIETDLEVDFAEPKGYIEPPRPSSSTRNQPSTAKLEALEKVEDVVTNIFSGSGQKLTNRVPNRAGPSSIHSASEPENSITSSKKEPPVIPLNLPFGRLFFGYRIIPPPNEISEVTQETEQPSTSAFQGPGNSLNSRKKPEK